jgi:hypothetical protein
MNTIGSLWEAKQQAVSQAGGTYWCVGLKGKARQKVRLWGRKVNVEDGSLVVYDPQERVTLAFAPGEWTFAYAASVLDGSPAVVESGKLN